MTLSLSAQALDRLWPHASHSVVDGVAASAHAFEKYGLTADAEIIDFLAQISEESAGATELEENLNYSAQAIVRCWPSRWPTPASAMPYAHNPRALADAAYGGRMGNIPGSDDGWKFRGRGFLQITGRTAYASMATALGSDLLSEPDLLLQPNLALESACAFWKNNNLNALSSVGNFRAETIRINGGLNGYATRLAWRARIQRCAKDLIISQA